MHLFFIWHSEINQKNKFSKLTYNYFHPQKRSFVNNFILVESCYKIDILILIRSRYHTKIFRGICKVIRKLLTI